MSGPVKPAELAPSAAGVQNQQLNIGATFSMSDRLAVIANVAAGLTDDAPDVTVSLRLSYRF